MRSILAMLLCQAVFLANDTCVKLVNETLPLGETLVLRNSVALLCILTFGLIFGGLALPRNVPAGPFSLRIIGEIASTLLLFWALSRMPIADLAAIGQFTPIAIMAAGAVFLGEPVGWRRWIAAAVGLFGVLLIIQPGTSAFNWAAIIAVVANAFGVLRDLATRMIGPVVSTFMLTLISAASVLLSGLALAPFEAWQMPGVREIGLSMLSGSLLSAGYVLLIVSLRTGDLAVVTPFRYAAVFWAILAGYLVWGELPNVLAVCGIAIVIAAGLYTIHRERMRRVEDQALDPQRS